MADQFDEFFNDLSRQPPSQTSAPARSGSNVENTSPAEDDTNPVPRPKRMACVVCRKRKLRCDGQKPSCGTCARVGHNCAYDEVRKKSGPKRGYVKQLEARLAQVETLLKNQEPETTQNEARRNNLPGASSNPSRVPNPASNTGAVLNFAMDSLSQIPNSFNSSRPSGGSKSRAPDVESNFEDDSCWEVIALGLEEPLPTQEVIDELFDIYFRKIHPSNPMIHRPRFFASMNLAPHMRPPVCLRYIMWTLAASITPKYSGLEEHLYARARKYIHLDEMKGHGEHMVSVGHCQAWTLISLYEFKQMFFPRAWISVGRGARMAAMMCLNRLDGGGLDVKHCIPPPRDWFEKEERRRTFWLSFIHDRFASIGTGWPMVFDERDIRTNLPSSEEAYLKGIQENAPSLREVLAGDVSNLSAMGSVAVMACIFGLNLTHLHRPDPQDREDDVNGEFWKRHRAYDNILLNISLSLPHSLRLPQGISDPNIIFCNMALQTSTICLHQAAIFKAERNKTMLQIAAESKRRCIIAADQIASIMKMVSHTDLSVLNPFIAFCLYVAARVFVQYLKSRPDGQAVKSSLQFLLTAMGALKKYSSLTESFLIQVDVELSGTNLSSSQQSMRNREANLESNEGCNPVINIRSSEAEYVTDAIVNVDSALYSGSSAGLSPSSQTFGSLPNRTRSNQIPSNDRTYMSVNRNGPFENATSSSSTNQSPQQDDSAMLTNFNMDVSPVVSGSSDNMNSENASPQTMNSSSNPSFTPPSIDQGLSNNRLNNSTTNTAAKGSLDPNFLEFNAALDDFVNISNNDNNNMSFAPLYDSNAMSNTMDTSEPDPTLPYNISWGPTPDFDAITTGLEGGLMGNPNNLSERQIELMLQGMGWNGFQG